MSKKLLVYFIVASAIASAVRADSLTDYVKSFAESVLDHARKNPQLAADLVGLVVAGGFGLFLFHKGRVAPGEYVLKSPRWVDIPNYGPMMTSAPVLPVPQTPARETTESISPQLRELLAAIVLKAQELRGLNSNAHHLGR